MSESKIKIPKISYLNDIKGLAGRFVERVVVFSHSYEVALILKPCNPSDEETFELLVINSTCSNCGDDAAIDSGMTTLSASQLEIAGIISIEQRDALLQQERDTSNEVTRRRDIDTLKRLLNEYVPDWNSNVEFAIAIGRQEVDANQSEDGIFSNKILPSRHGASLAVIDARNTIIARLANKPAAGRDLKVTEASIDYMLGYGWQESDIIDFLNCTEEVNPDLETPVALKRMRKIVKRVGKYAPRIVYDGN